MPRGPPRTASSPRAIKRRSLSTPACPTSQAPTVRGGWLAAEPPALSGGSDACALPATDDRGDGAGHRGVVAKGLLYLLFIGIVVFLGALLLGALRMRRRLGRRPAR